MAPRPFLSSEKARNALEMLTSVQLDRENELKQYNKTEDLSDFDEECDSECPIYDSFFHNGGRNTILRMTNFSSREFMALWGSMDKLVREVWDNGRGRCYQNTPKDILFMVLTVFKHGVQWDFLGRMFGIQGGTFERMINKFVSVIAEPLSNSFVFGMETRFTFSKMMTQNATVGNFRYARYAVDVFFHHSNRPSGNMQEGKVYFSGKHKLYGYKTEVSVMPNGMALGMTDHFPGSKADVDIFYSNHDFHETALRKRNDEKDIDDFGELSDKYPNMWAVLAYKGYRGGEHKVRLVRPSFKPKNGVLTVPETNRNRLVSSDRIVVENWFGRVTTLWALFAIKWRWAEQNYDRYFELATALTNFHIRSHPLRAADGERYVQLKNRLRHIGQQMFSKRKAAQKKYRERKRMRLDAEFEHGLVQDAETVDPFAD